MSASGREFAGRSKIFLPAQLVRLEISVMLDVGNRGNKGVALLCSAYCLLVYRCWGFRLLGLVIWLLVLFVRRLV